jgi:uncharacterized membrane protein
MHEQVVQSLGILIQLLEITGASLLTLGFVYATIKWIQESRNVGIIKAVSSYKRSLGRSVLIGLEVLVAATIIKTITIDPTWEGIALLAIMVAIRTVLGWTTVLEISGRWPWQRGG